ncbi:MAG: site-specific recombinase XerD, partial [Planctomycetota bacterium]
MRTDAVSREKPSGSPQQAMADFLVHLGAELQVSRNTVAAYRNDLERLLRGETSLPSRAQIDRHLGQLLQSHAPASVARAAAAIRGFYRFLHAEGEVDGDVTEGLLGPKLEQKLPNVLSRRSIAKLLDREPSTDLCVRDLAILHVLYATGCRVSEV